ncbi:MAG: polysaccharide pyruvyl transferase family protein [Actinomycetota bacterium]|nr:polysaccharide pyruvyl transferase family protein [Actinomycetota bacterium]
MKNRVLVYGMHGYRNLGAEARLVAIVDQLGRMVPDAEIVTNTLDRHALDYLRGMCRLHYFHPVFHRPAGKRLIDSADCVILSEGAMIGDRFSPVLLSALTRAIEQADRAGIASVGLALDSNYISPKRRERTVRALNTIDLLTVRAPGCDEHLAGYGVKVPMPVTADCAVSMPLPGPDVVARVRERYGFGAGPVHGIAPVDFHMWPAKAIPVGRPSDFVRWPYKATWPDGGRERSRKLLAAWVEHARHLLSLDRRARVGIVIQDRGDVRFAHRLHRELGVPERSFVIDGQTSDPYEMSAAYSLMETLSSSRYHAIVLASAYAIPFVALGHDNRTEFYCRDMGLDRLFVAHDDPDVVGTLRERHARLAEERDEIRERIARGFAEMRVRDAVNYRLLGDLLEGIGHRVERAPADQPTAVG